MRNEVMGPAVGQAAAAVMSLSPVAEQTEDKDKSNALTGEDRRGEGRLDPLHTSNEYLLL